MRCDLPSAPRSGAALHPMLRRRMSSDPLSDSSATVRAAMRWILAAFYAAAGMAHLLAPDKLLSITPSWVPFAREVVFHHRIARTRGRGGLGDEAAAPLGGPCIS